MAARKHEEEEEFDNEVPTMDDLTLVSNDGYQFVVERRTAMISQTLRNILYGAGNFEEVQTKTIRLPIRAIILERVIEYWHYRSQYSDHIDQLPRFDIDPKMALELLQAADFLQT
jgi:hypothetical protein